ncbi:leucine dehydrogenase [Solitalea longa]|uniref:Leucine dehydrogenase n=1 Tax=Solitalea longa TaxID=2079460 RepID=A0A2S5A0N4_9SPHI|nr:Glu/Leu/Phe/Val dehydrogenase [Solitalea longa]POY36115.1 leucine dehydrogenase [Solitalea longa]
MFETKEINSVDANSVFDKMAEQSHKNVVFCSDKATGLKAIIAIHDTTLGPAIGGTRMWHYRNEADALDDVLRLSRGMTYKSAITGLNFGGGKAVIIGDSNRDKSEALIRRFARFINNLNGEFITSQDVGTNARDMEYIRMETPHVVGLSESTGGTGHTGPVSAYGVYMGMKASAKEQWGNDSLSGKSVAVQGIGNVGEYLVKYLRDEGSRVYISDLDEERLTYVARKHDAIIVPNNQIYDLDVDIYAPCALGATVNSDTIKRLKCSIIAGSANNQLQDEELHGQMLLEMGILYAPDFLINAGGLISVHSEISGIGKKRTMQLAESIYGVTLDIFRKSKKEQITPYNAALKIADKRIADIRQLKANS